MATSRNSTTASSLREGWGGGRGRALNVGVPSFGGSDRDARAGAERGRAPQVRLTSGGASKRLRRHVETVPRRERRRSSRAEGSASKKVV